MKKFWSQFVLRGLLAASGGPLVLAVIYGVLGASEVVTVLTPGEVCLGIVSITLMAFIAGGITAVYQLERLPLFSAILLNDWISRDWTALGIFTGIFVVGYALIWACVYLVTRRKTERINKKLH